MELDIAGGKVEIRLPGDLSMVAEVHSERTGDIVLTVPQTTTKRFVRTALHNMIANNELDHVAFTNSRPLDLTGVTDVHVLAAVMRASGLKELKVDYDDLISNRGEIESYKNYDTRQIMIVLREFDEPKKEEND